MITLKALFVVFEAKLVDQILFISCLIFHLPSYFLFVFIFLSTLCHVLQLGCIIL